MRASLECLGGIVSTEDDAVWVTVAPDNRPPAVGSILVRHQPFHCWNLHMPSVNALSSLQMFPMSWESQFFPRTHWNFNLTIPESGDVARPWTCRQWVLKISACFGRECRCGMSLNVSIISASLGREWRCGMSLNMSPILVNFKVSKTFGRLRIVTPPNVVYI